MVRPLRESKQLSTVAELLNYLDATFEDPDRKGSFSRVRSSTIALKLAISAWSDILGERKKKE